MQEDGEKETASPVVTVLILDNVTLHWSPFQMVLSLHCVNLLLQKPTAQTL